LNVSLFKKATLVAACTIAFSAMAQEENKAAAETQPAVVTEEATATAEQQPVATPVETATPAPTAPAVFSQLPQEIVDAVGAPEAGKGLVVFFRPKKFVGAAIGFKVREKEVELGKLRNGNYFSIQVEPGVHEYVVHSESKDITRIEVEAGETYFLAGEINMGVLAGRPNLTPSTAVNFQADLKSLKKSKPLD
jgi:hypothetical protein